MASAYFLITDAFRKHTARGDKPNWRAPLGSAELPSASCSHFPGLWRRRWSDIMLDIPAKPESATHFLNFSKGPDEEGGNNK
jgi:hypothetical protein